MWGGSRNSGMCSAVCIMHRTRSIFQDFQANRTYMFRWCATTHPEARHETYGGHLPQNIPPHEYEMRHQAHLKHIQTPTSEALARSTDTHTHTPSMQCMVCSLKHTIRTQVLCKVACVMCNLPPEQVVRSE